MTSAEYAAHMLASFYPAQPHAEQVTDALIDLMHYCDATRGVSWQRCLQAAIAQHQKERDNLRDASAKGRINPISLLNLRPGAAGVRGAYRG